MATDKPLVSVYMPPELLDRLKVYQQDNDIKSASSAVVAALQEFFQMGATAGYAPIARVEELEQRLNQLSELVEELRHSPVRQQSSTRSAPHQPQKAARRAIAPTDGESVDHAADGWLNLKEVAATFRDKETGTQARGTNYSTLSTQRGKMDDAEFLDYLYQRTLETGRPQRWEFDRSRGQKGMFRPIAVE
ncbi:hypothetical protein H6F67_27185 [Microcoleus sp. FACHB-1515]|uniref:hypothetical protein n=1 Tax=Cyanophyceae TaxID=3028117 RepID=UPI001684828F|nr:hypothetical protein [Microcoleus sp. FACHB-1515]MBD2093523.1 hypothetical protein [Microcoleus sp. FACHB-1515]